MKHLNAGVRPGLCILRDGKKIMKMSSTLIGVLALVAGAYSFWPAVFEPYHWDFSNRLWNFNR